MALLNKIPKENSAAEGQKRVKEPLFHIVKRDAPVWYKAWLIRAAAIVLALLLCAVVTVLLARNVNPLDVFKAMISGNFGTVRRIWVMLQSLSILLCVSLALTPAFKMRFWNIGGEGQILIGGLATAACMKLLGAKMPPVLLIFVMLAASIAAGAIWALIPAVFKAQWNTNETLFTLMMNYVAIQIVSYFTMVWEAHKGSANIGIINSKTHYGWLPQIGNEYLLSIIVVLALTVAMYIYLRYSKHGYEISVVGESQNTARYIGINVKKVIIRTMILSGALCGIAGFLLVGSIDHTITPTSSNNRGFTAIMVSWLAKFNPLMMLLTSFLIVFLECGAKEITTKFSLDKSFSDILTGIILFFIIGCEFFINYQIKFRHSQKEVA
ncbi:MAG: ABC transporter permease [Clostridia bacterium]|nr:ABC transporter permease [Clostridia bacterium]MBR0509027.1 ABC transporter permease [Clostridia bacterium]MBR0537837.1 ABC transporter permease [Clostridia bacterium]